MERQSGFRGKLPGQHAHRHDGGSVGLASAAAPVHAASWRGGGRYFVRRGGYFVRESQCSCMAARLRQTLDYQNMSFASGMAGSIHCRGGLAMAGKARRLMAPTLTVADA